LLSFQRWPFQQSESSRVGSISRRIFGGTRKLSASELGAGRQQATKSGRVDHQFSRASESLGHLWSRSSVVLSFGLLGSLCPPGSLSLLFGRLEPQRYSDSNRSNHGRSLALFCDWISSLGEVGLRFDDTEGLVVSPRLSCGGDCCCRSVTGLSPSACGR
jgi:hypothetical protein